jgi:nuclear receptor subfamily 1 group F protein 4
MFRPVLSLRISPLPPKFGDREGSFELACLRMSRYFDVNTQAVLFGDAVLPAQAFITADTVEMNLVKSCFEFAQEIAELKLTDTELGLFSAFILLSPGIISQSI